MNNQIHIVLKFDFSEECSTTEQLVAAYTNLELAERHAAVEPETEVRSIELRTALPADWPEGKRCYQAFTSGYSGVDVNRVAPTVDPKDLLVHQMPQSTLWTVYLWSENLETARRDARALFEATGKIDKPVVLDEETKKKIGGLRAQVEGGLQS